MFMAESRNFEARGSGSNLGYKGSGMYYCTRRHLLACSLVMGASAKASFATAEDFTLTIARKYSSNECTSGYFAVGGNIIAYTLERPWRGNAPLISSIPVGRYKGVLRYDHTDQWRIELQGVPGRTHVQIHTGNTPDDTEGCILVGLKLGSDLCSVIDSSKAYADLKKAFYGTENPSSTPNKQITVSVES